MPMPASTFTLAVGHWYQVTAEIPPALEREVRHRTDCGKAAKPAAAGSGEWTEAECVSGLETSSGEVVKGSLLQTGRYFINLYVIFFLLLVSPPPSQSAFNARSGPSAFHGKTFLLPYKKG